MILKGILHSEEQDKYNHENRVKVNFTRCVYRQLKNRKESNTTETAKWQELLYTFPYYL
jgi:hypothetical protein